MARIIGIEYEIRNENGAMHWVQFGDSRHDLAYRGYEHAPEPEVDFFDLSAEEVIARAVDNIRGLVSMAERNAVERRTIREGEQ
jgi:hypothetical protein